MRCRVLLLSVSALLAACSERPVAPEVDAPLFLLGGSPLQPITLDEPGQSLLVPLTVTKGIVQAADNDRFWLRATAGFLVDDGEDPVAIIICIEKPVPTKQDQIRGGGEVAVIMDIDIPDDDWAKLVAAATQGATITAKVQVELLLIDAAGQEHVLDAVEKSGIINPGAD
ncbi:MAG: hypothetical protein JSW43_04335 [Gemmatimonadota bacterium]|nr:MAG: hypothetical protein JSW43_04335 [Gemmatimonadota bacterium]